MIPKIIHQQWEGDALPDLLTQLARTWKEKHPDWKYEFWDGGRMESFVRTHYPQLIDTYLEFRYNMQRWDAFRFLVLYKTGGLYVDFDYECILPVDDYVAEEGKCYFSMEPEDHCVNFFGRETFNGALMVTCPGHPFFKKIIDHIFLESKFEYTNNMVRDVHASTGPVMLTDLYQDYPNRDEIVLWPAELASPWTKTEVRRILNDIADESYMEKKLEKAFAVHYFFSLWA